jgi:hypothetical protein
MPTDVLSIILVQDFEPVMWVRTVFPYTDHTLNVPMDDLFKQGGAVGWDVLSEHDRWACAAVDQPA